MRKVLGLGNALIDILTQLENDAFLGEFSLSKGGMHLVDAVDAGKISRRIALHTHYRTSGGSAANTIHGLACLGFETGFIGKVGDDEMGDFFARDLVTNNIRSHLVRSASASGRALTLISPDSERTFATFLGAAIELSAEELEREVFEAYDCLHVEGYLVQNPSLLLKALRLAKENGLLVSLDLSSYTVVEKNRDLLGMALREYVDLVFSNEEEARAMTGHDPLTALGELNGWCDLAVVKTGSRGSHVGHDGKVYDISPVAANSIDTTGAGDLYASGFLFGLLNGYSPQDSGAIGSLVAGRVIEVIGAKMAPPAWEEVRSRISEILAR
jgi:sugar/nucleoside kinase (ribokinase family)